MGAASPCIEVKLPQVCVLRAAKSGVVCAHLVKIITVAKYFDSVF